MNRRAPILAEALQAVSRRTRSSVLTSLGVALGILALVATVAISATVSAQVSSRFTALMATFVHASSLPASTVDEPRARDAALTRVRHLSGVRSAGLLRRSSGEVHVGSPGGASHDAQVIGAQPGALDAWGTQTRFGTSYDAGHEARGEHVAIVGTELAAQLGLSGWSEPVQINVGGVPFLVIGVLQGADPSSGIDAAVLVPYAALGGIPAHAQSVELAIGVQPGAARQVAQEAPLAFDPTEQSSIVAEAPPDPQTLRQQVSGDTQAMVLVFAAVSLIIGALGISNTVLVSVMERRHEIGVRTALGAQTADIVRQILWEGTAIGLFGGLLGTLLGFDVAVAVALVNGWAVAVPAWIVPSGIVLGAAVGAAASAYPAFRAARIDAVEALMA